MRSHFNKQKWHLLADYHALNQLAHYKRLWCRPHRFVFNSSKTCSCAWILEL